MTERGVTALLTRARARLERVTAEQAAAAMRYGEGLLVDIRPAAQRITCGRYPAHW